jgi:hypothetical protein
MDKPQLVDHPGQLMGGKGSGRKPSPCGTPAKYGWHRRRGEDCTICKNAKTVYYRERRGSKPRQPPIETSAQKKQRVNGLTLQCKLQAGACFDCGLICTVDNWYVFDWDHRVPTDKSFTIGDRKHGVSKAVLMAEIAKCDLVCANCHRHRTFGQLKSGLISAHNKPNLEQLTLF